MQSDRCGWFLDRLARMIHDGSSRNRQVARETSARSSENPKRTRAVRRRFNGRVCWPKARRNIGSAVAEVFMNHAG